MRRHWDVSGAKELNEYAPVGPAYSFESCIVRVVTSHTEKSVHRIASETCGPAFGSLLGAHELVGGALVNAKRITRVFGEYTIQNPRDVGIADVVNRTTCAPRHHVVYPVGELAVLDCRLSAWNSEVISNSFIEIRCIQMPCSEQLFVVANAHYALGFGFCPTERRQKHPGKYGYYGNDDEELNQRET